MAKRKIYLIKGNCKRCNKELHTASQPLIATAGMKKKYELICSSCMTKEEKVSMENDFRRVVQGRIAVGDFN